MTDSVNSAPHWLKNMGWGALRIAVAFPIEHPLDYLKVCAQANPQLSIRDVINNIIKEKGLWGFANTAGPNLGKRFFRESIRWPFIDFSHEFLVTHFPTVFTRHGTRSQIGTAVSVALFDSLFILPFEALIAYRVKRDQSYTTFFKERFTKDGVGSLYKGLSINLMRQSVVWTSVLGVSSEAKKQFQIYDPNNAHPILQQIITSIMITASFIGLGLPIDFIKTRVQMNRHFQNIHPVEVGRILVKQHGVRCLYAGAPVVALHTLIHVTFTSMLLKEIGLD